MKITGIFPFSLIKKVGSALHRTAEPAAVHLDKDLLRKIWLTMNYIGIDS